VVNTTDSKIQIATVARLLVRLNGEEVTPRYQVETAERRADTFFACRVERGQVLSVSKVVGISTSAEGAGERTAADRMQTSNLYPLRTAMRTTQRAKFLDYEAVHSASAEVWQKLWQTMDVQVEGGERLTQQLLRLNLYHLLIAASPCTTELKLDVGIGPRGNTGETYRGHTFWDTEIFILPLVIAKQPELAKQLLEYRFKRLDAARAYADENGYSGAMFPWNSGLVGNEQTQTVKENPISGSWDPDNSRLQRHVSLAVAHGIWHYYHVTQDKQFLEDMGAEMFLEICRFWASAAQRDSKTGKYSIAKVMGPDEFHEKYPGATEGGVRDNAYTNIMVSWAMEKAEELYAAMGPEAQEKLSAKISLSDVEWAKWADVKSNLRLCASERGIIEQFDKFFNLVPVSEELLDEAARLHHGRVDRLLKARGDTPDRYQCAKQADFLMAPWVLGEEQTQRIIERLLGSTLPEDWLKNNYEFYVARTAHGSTLSRLVHGEIALRAGLAGEGVTLYDEALGADFHDLHENTSEGIHTGVMVGTVWQAVSCFGGLDLKGDIPSFNPRFPSSWRTIAYGFTFRGIPYECELTPDTLRLRVPAEAGTVKIAVQGTECAVKAGEWSEFPLRAAVIAEPPLPKLAANG
jgi:trehalose/maltose hydrolase-like predicted phosphorylase